MGYIICPAPVKESLHVTISPCQPASQSQGNRDGGQRKDRLLGGEIGRRGPSEPSDGVNGGCQQQGLPSSGLQIQPHFSFARKSSPPWCAS